jgi:parvulin-like peptidyl-prolyl isomerase
LHAQKLSTLLVAGVMAPLFAMAFPAAIPAVAQSAPEPRTALRTAPLPPGAVATVNGIPIARARIEEHLWREWGPVYLDYAVRSRIVRQEAAKRGLSVSPEELQTRMQEYQAQFNSVSGRQPRDWELFVQRFGLSNFEERQKDELLADKIGLDEASRVTLNVSEKARVIQDLERAAHKVHVRHVLIGIGPGYGGRTEAAARARAEEVRSKIAAGMKWEEAAGTYSDDISTRANGGDLGFFTRDQMVKPLEDEAFAATPGDLLHVVRVPEGFDVFQVIERQDKPPAEAEIQAAMDEVLKRKQETAKSPDSWFPPLAKAYATARSMPFLQSAAPAGQAAKKPAPRRTGTSVKSR